MANRIMGNKALQEKVLSELENVTNALQDLTTVLKRNKKILKQIRDKL